MERIKDKGRGPLLVAFSQLARRDYKKRQRTKEASIKRNRERLGENHVKVIRRRMRRTLCYGIYQQVHRQEFLVGRLLGDIRLAESNNQHAYVLSLLDGRLYPALYLIGKGDVSSLN